VNALRNRTTVYKITDVFFTGVVEDNNRRNGTQTNSTK